MARVSFALCPELKTALREEAESNGATPSALVEILVRQRIGFLRAKGKSRLPDPLLIAADELRSEIAASLSDGRITAAERARATERIAQIMDGLWGQRSRRARA